jgi:hypothetical protein
MGAAKYVERAALQPATATGPSFDEMLSTVLLQFE